MINLLNEIRKYIRRKRIKKKWEKAVEGIYEEPNSKEFETNVFYNVKKYLEKKLELGSLTISQQKLLRKHAENVIKLYKEDFKGLGQSDRHSVNLEEEVTIRYLHDEFEIPDEMFFNKMMARNRGEFIDYLWLKNDRMKLI